MFPDDIFPRKMSLPSLWVGEGAHGCRGKGALQGETYEAEYI